MMIRLIYRWLLWLHPPAFRRQFADEMLWIFDEESSHGVTSLVADGFVSLARQWLVRSGVWKVVPAAAGGLLTLLAGLTMMPAVRHGSAFIKLKPLEGLFVLMTFSALLAVSLTLTLCVLWFRFLRRLRA